MASYKSWLLSEIWIWSEISFGGSGLILSFVLNLVFISGKIWWLCGGWTEVHFHTSSYRFIFTLFSSLIPIVTNFKIFYNSSFPLFFDLLTFFLFSFCLFFFAISECWRILFSMRDFKFLRWNFRILMMWKLGISVSGAEAA